MEVAEPTDDSNHESKVTHTQPQTLLDMIVFLVLGNMRRSGCGYHFAQKNNQLQRLCTQKSCLFMVSSVVGSEGFSHCFERTHRWCPGESVENEVRMLQGERVCRRKTARVRWLLFLWCRLATFWWPGSDVVKSAWLYLLPDLESPAFSRTLDFRESMTFTSLTPCLFTCRIVTSYQRFCA